LINNKLERTPSHLIYVLVNVCAECKTGIKGRERRKHNERQEEAEWEGECEIIQRRVVCGRPGRGDQWGQGV